ncbi:MAG: hypothetical protein SGPRY_012870, partial [Prymnesium sp.]
YHRDPSEWDMPACPVVKAYKNWDFLGSSHARHIRILTEYEETLQRLRANGVRSTVMFFGSARAKDRPQYDAAMAKLRSELEIADAGSADAKAAEASIKKLEASEWSELTWSPPAFDGDDESCRLVLSLWILSVRVHGEDD